MVNTGVVNMFLAARVKRIERYSVLHFTIDGWTVVINLNAEVYGYSKCLLVFIGDQPSHFYRCIIIAGFKCVVITS